MNAELEKTERRCPTVEALSAWVDGEAGGQEAEIAAHLEVCSSCREKTEAYGRIGEMLRQHIRSSVPGGLTERIRDAVDLSIRSPRPKTIVFPAHLGLMLRIAAMFAVCGTILLYSFYPKSPSDRGISSGVAAIRPAPGGTASGVDKFPYFSAHNNAVGGVSVPLTSLVGASYGEVTPPVFTGAAGTAVVRRDQPHSIADQVRQVWAVGSLSDVRKQLAAMGRAAGISASGLRFDRDGNRLLLSARMTKRDLVRLVRQCRAAGFDLLSPDSPQPEHNYFFGNPSDPVSYRAEFVPDSP